MFNGLGFGFGNMRYNFKYNVYNAHIVKEKSFGLFAPGDASKVLGWNNIPVEYDETYFLWHWQPGRK